MRAALFALLLIGCAATSPTPASPARQAPNGGEAVHAREALQVVVEEAAREVAPGAELRVQPWLVGWGTIPGDPWRERFQLTRAESEPGDYVGLLVELRASTCGWSFPSESGAEGVVTVELAAGPYAVQLTSFEPLLAARGELRAEQRLLELVPFEKLAQALTRRLAALPPGAITPRCPLGSGG